MFLESITQIILLTPLMLPIAVDLGVNPIAFGIILIISCEVGFLRPSGGANLFVAARIITLGIEKISVEVIPFVFAYIVVLIIVAAFATITTFSTRFGFWAVSGQLNFKHSS